ncbi:hypothetical protein M1O17_05315, partial [Dehalococcoidia bacterium]|nr:hypothetical protein [Dehalococcoidia bacterium]
IAKAIPMALALVLMLTMAAGCPPQEVDLPPAPIAEVPEEAVKIYGLARHLDAAVSTIHTHMHVMEGAKGEFEKYKAEIQHGIDTIQDFAYGVEQRRAELYDITKGLEGEHVEAIHKAAANFKESVDRLFVYAQQLGALEDDVVANEEEILEIAGELHMFLHASLEGPPRGMVRRARALGYEAPESGKEIVWEFNAGTLAYCVQRLENGNTLIVSRDDDLWRVIEVTPNGEIVWEHPMRGFNAQRLPNGNTLIAQFPQERGGPGRVIEVSPDNEIIWEYSGDFVPYNAERLPNGNTVISDMRNARIIEVTPEKEIVWEFTDLVRIGDIQVLPNGNILAVETRDIEYLTDTRVIEITRDKKIIWEFCGFDAMFSTVQRLPNGNTLITDNDRIKKENPRIIEVAPNGEIVWEYTNYDFIYPWGVHRLENGNTLIADGRFPRVIEIGVK